MMPKRKNLGFTLMEMLIVVAIITILVSIAIPSFTGLLEKSREATDLANVRSAYAEVMINALLSSGETDQIEERVPLKQKKDGFQGFSDLTIGDVSEKDASRWIGQPQANGDCIVRFDEDLYAVVLDWGGGYPFLRNENFFGYTKKEVDGLVKQHDYRFDSGYPALNSYVSRIKEEIPDGSLLKTGTWVFLRGSQKNDTGYLIWSSYDQKTIKPNQPTPVIILDEKTNKYYVGTSTPTYEGNCIKIIGKIPTESMTTTMQGLIKNSKGCNSLEDAYREYLRQMQQTGGK